MSEYEFYLTPPDESLAPQSCPADGGLELSPQRCAASGLDCYECVGASARQLAQVCHGVRGRALGQLFTQMYPSPGCTKMHRVFAEAYREASCQRREAQTAAIHAETRQPQEEFIRVDVSAGQRRPDAVETGFTKPRVPLTRAAIV